MHVILFIKVIWLLKDVIKGIKMNLKRFFTDEIKLYVSNLIVEDLSSEQIVGKSLQQDIDCVSIETIHKFVCKDKNEGDYLCNHLGNQEKIYRKLGLSKD